MWPPECDLSPQIKIGSMHKQNPLYILCWGETSLPGRHYTNEIQALIPLQVFYALGRLKDKELSAFGRCQYKDAFWHAMLWPYLRCSGSIAAVRGRGIFLPLQSIIHQKRSPLQPSTV